MRLAGILTFLPRKIGGIVRGVSVEGFVASLVVFSWLVRFLFLSIPIPLDEQERAGMNAASMRQAAEFACTVNWAERWQIAYKSTDHVHLLWSLPHLLFGAIAPSPGENAFAVSLMAALGAMAALAGAANRLYGRRGLLFALLIAGLSPMFLLYALRVSGTILAALWICVALFCFSSPRWKSWQWAIGGLAVGLALGSAEGTGAVAVALGVGLAFSALAGLFARKVSIWRRLWGSFVCPALAVGFAILPVWLISYWTRYSGGKFAFHLLEAWDVRKELSREEFLVQIVWWRRFCELDPFLISALVAAAVFGVRHASIRIPSKILLAAILLCVASGLSLASHSAQSRVWIPLLIAGVVGAAWGLGLGWMKETRTDADDTESKKELSPLSAPALLIAIAVWIVLLTQQRELSFAPRMTFPGWPLLALTLSGLCAGTLRERMRPAIFGAGLLGIIWFLGGAVVAFQTKNVEFRKLAFASEHPQLKELEGASLMNEAVYPALEQRANDKLVVIGPVWRYYPGFLYDDDPYKIETVRERLRAHKLDHLLQPEDLAYASVFFESSDPTGQMLPPPGTPECPSGVRAIDVSGKRYTPPINPYRGLELKIRGSRKGLVLKIPGVKREFEFFQPPEQKAKVAEVTAFVPLVAEGDEKTTRTFGFEWQAITPYVPDAAKLILSIYQDDLRLGSFPVPIAMNTPAGAIGSTAQATRLFRCPIAAGAGTHEIRFVAQLNIPDKTYCPPVSLYIRRPFISRTPYPPQPVSGYAYLLEADITAPKYANFDGEYRMLAYTRRSFGINGKGVSWKTAPWTGKSANTVVFAASYYLAPQIQLSLNGKVILNFTPHGEDESWSQNGFQLSMRAMPMAVGMHGIFSLKLPDGWSPAGEPLTISAKVLGGVDDSAWFGVRDLTDAKDLLP